MRRGFTDASTLLHDLLDRHEARPESKRLLSHLDQTGIAGVAEHDACIARLVAVERAGGIRIKRSRIDGVEQVEHVSLITPDVVYAQLGRVPAAQQATIALSRLRRRADLPREAAAIIDEVAQAWSRRVGRFGLAPGRADALEQALDLAIALNRRLNEPDMGQLDYRTFSRAAVGDSKALDRLEASVATLMPLVFPSAGGGELTPPELIGTFGVAKLPQPLLLSGPVALDGVVLPFSRYLGLPAEDAARISLAFSVDYVLTIENFTSFVRHASLVNEDCSGLVLYTGGFPARAILKALLHLIRISSAPVYHWGDIDPGGLQIFRHLERELVVHGVKLKPHLMDCELLRSCGRVDARPDRRLKPGGASGSAIETLWDMLALGDGAMELEQEALAPTLPAAKNREPNAPLRTGARA